MKCENCGEEIKDGFDYCENCGAPAGNAVVLDKDSLKKVKEYNRNVKIETQKKQKEQAASEKESKKRKKEQEAEKLPFYERKSAEFVSPMLGISSGIMMIVSPLLPWIRVRGSYIGGTLYSNASLMFFTDEISFSFTLLSVLAMLLGIVMAYVTIVNNKKQDKYSKLPGLQHIEVFLEKRYTKLIPAVLGFILLFFIRHQNSYERIYNRYNDIKIMIENNKNSAGSFTAGNAYCEVGYGIGNYVFVISIILFIVSLGFKFVIDTLNEED